MGDVYGGVPEEEEERVHEWEAGLPNLDVLTPLTRALIPLDLLTAFNIPLEPYRTSGDVSRATDDTMSSIRGSNCKPFDENLEVISDGEIEEEEEEEEEGSDPKKARRNESPEEGDSSSAKAPKRSRLVWTPQLHKRFVEVVTHLGLKSAVPKTIMQLMNVEGLTRENVASHLQKYRLYLKRMQGDSFDAPANMSERHFPSSPASECVPENGNMRMPTQMPYGMMMPIPMPMPAMHMGLENYNGLESNQYHHQHNQYHHHQHQYNWNHASNNKYGS